MTTSLIVTLLCIGLLAGILSGLVGIGGGIILVPCLVYFLNYDQHLAQGTSLGVLTFPVVALAFFIYFKKYQHTATPIQFGVIAFIAIGFVIGGLLGSNIAIRINQETLKKIFAIILFYTAFKMLHWDTAIINLFKK